MTKVIGTLISGIILILLILLIILFTTLSRGVSISIGDTEISIVKDVAYSFYMGTTRSFIESGEAKRYKNWAGKTRHTVSLNTPSGTIVIPKDSRAKMARSVIGHDTVTFTNVSGFYDTLRIFGNEITQGISSISMSGDGEIMGFSVHNEPVPMTLNKITMKVVNMRRGFSVNYQGRVTQYVNFRCNDISPIELDKDFTIIFNDNENKTFSVNIEENNYGFYVYTLTSSSSEKKSFILKHPSLEKETKLYQIRFDVFYDDVIGYKINSDDEEIIISYKEKSIEVNGKSDEILFKELLREALRRNEQKDK